MHYRYETAVLTGGRFAVWLARTFGVGAKLVKLNLTPEEAAKLGLKPTETPKLDLPGDLQNGPDE